MESVCQVCWGHQTCQVESAWAFSEFPKPGHQILGQPNHLDTSSIGVSNLSVIEVFCKVIHMILELYRIQMLADGQWWDLFWYVSLERERGGPSKLARPWWACCAVDLALLLLDRIANLNDLHICILSLSYRHRYGCFSTYKGIDRVPLSLASDSRSTRLSVDVHVKTCSRIAGSRILCCSGLIPIAHFLQLPIVIDEQINGDTLGTVLWQ